MLLKQISDFHTYTEHNVNKCYLDSEIDVS